MQDYFGINFYFYLHRWLTAMGLSAYIDNFAEQNLISVLQLDDFSLDVSFEVYDFG